MEPESATRRAGRFAARKAIPIRFAGAPQSGHGRQSVPSLGGSAAPIRDEAKEAGTNAAGISDAARRAIRGAKGNPNSLRRAPQKGGSESDADKCRRQLHGLTP